MRSVYFLIILVILNNCSFDNKSGIWKNEKQIATKKIDLTQDFQSIKSKQEKFNKTIDLDKKYIFKKYFDYQQRLARSIFFLKENNLKNFSYLNQNKLIFKSRKLTKFKTNQHLLYKNNKNYNKWWERKYYSFSITENEFIFKFNFYKKRYQKIVKILNLGIDDNAIYVSDNLGFIYALDQENGRILWAKNYKVPFRSNIKIVKNKIVVANQGNSVFFLDKENGEILKQFLLKRMFLREIL